MLNPHGSARSQDKFKHQKHATPSGRAVVAETSVNIMPRDSWCAKRFAHCGLRDTHWQKKAAGSLIRSWKDDWGILFIKRSCIVLFNLYIDKID